MSLRHENFINLWLRFSLEYIFYGFRIDTILFLARKIRLFIEKNDIYKCDFGRVCVKAAIFVMICFACTLLANG